MVLEQDVANLLTSVSAAIIEVLCSKTVNDCRNKAHTRFEVTAATGRGATAE